MRSVLEPLLKLNVEGVTVRKLAEASGLSETRTQQILDNHSGIFYCRVFKSHRFYYLRHARFLKTAHYILSRSDASCLDFGWSDDQIRVMCVLANPRFRSRSVYNIVTDSGVPRPQAAKIIEDFETEGLLTRTNEMVTFNYMGFPVWAAIIIGRIFLA